MRIRPHLITSRYQYLPDLVAEHGSPLYDTKHETTVDPLTTVRVGANIFIKPKQMVYVLNHPTALSPHDENTPSILLPRFILHKDGNKRNILFENLKFSATSGRWTNDNRDPQRSSECIEAPSGVLIPKHLLATMPQEMLYDLGLAREDIYAEGVPNPRSE
jgi:hypothetical protein